MDLLHGLGIGFGVAFTAQNVVAALIGCTLGTLIGVLPGIGPVAMVAMLLPATYGLDATPALILLAGVCYGARYGGSTTAILVNMAGEPSSAVTAIDGYQMARQGRAGAALSIATLGSFVAGCTGTALLALLGPPLTALAFRFGPAEYFSLMVLGLVGVVVLASGSLAKAIAMALLGLLLAQVGTDIGSGTTRYGFGLAPLGDGLGFVVVAIGIYGVGEIISNLATDGAQHQLMTRRIEQLRPERRDIEEAWPSVLRGTALGSLVGVLPGGGSLLASVAAYALEKRAVRQPRIPFGKGAIQGVAGPDSANNAATQTSFVPMLTLGIPTNALMALLLGAMTLKGLQPGPQVMASNPQLFWGLIASMWIGNALLVVLNLPLIGLWTRLLTVPYRFLFPAMTLLFCIGAWSLGHSAFDVYLVAIFALLGHLFHKLGCETAPLFVGFILGPMMEENLRHALAATQGDWGTLVTRPLSSGLLIASALLLSVAAVPSIQRRRDAALPED